MSTRYISGTLCNKACSGSCSCSSDFSVRGTGECASPETVPSRFASLSPVPTVKLSLQTTKTDWFFFFSRHLEITYGRFGVQNPVWKLLTWKQHPSHFHPMPDGSSSIIVPLLNMSVSNLGLIFTTTYCDVPPERKREKLRPDSLQYIAIYSTRTPEIEV